MRRIALIAIAALSIAACSNEPTSPAASTIALSEAGAFGTAMTLAGGYDASLYQTRLFNALPDELKLTDAQRESIRSLVSAFEQSTKADREALGAVLREARQAVEAKKSRQEVEAILAKGADARRRLAEAEGKLRKDIEAVLTAEQRAWIAAHSPRACRADKFPPLSDAQKAQIRALETAFQENNKADLASVKAVVEEARAAARAGKSREEVVKILEKAAPAMARLAVARVGLRAGIVAVLTPEQKASGCLPLG